MSSRFVSFLKKFVSWKVFFVVVALLVLGGIVYAVLKPPTPPTYVIDIVSRGDLKQTVEASGDVEAVQRVDLAFETAGQVSTLLVEVGDSVEVGQILAWIDDSSVGASLDEAAAALRGAQARLDERQAGLSAESRTALYRSLDEARLTYEQAVLTQNNARAALVLKQRLEAERVANAERELTRVQTDGALSVVHEQASLIDQIKLASIAVRAAISSADQIIGVQDTVTNQLYVKELSALNVQPLINARNLYPEAVRVRDQVEGTVLKVLSGAPIEQIQQTSTEVKTSLRIATQLLLETRLVLDATVGGSVNLSSDELAALKASLRQEQEALQAAEQALLGADRIFESAARTALSQTEAAQDALTLARETSMQTIELAKQDVVQAEQSVLNQEARRLQIEADIAAQLAPVRFVELAPLLATVDESRFRYQAAVSRFNETRLTSPIAGVVTDLTFEVGELVSLGTVGATIQTLDHDLFQVRIDVPESDIVKVSLGDPAEITIDAFGADQRFLGEVVKVDPAEHVIDGVVFYEVLIVMAQDGLEATKLRPGLSADVEMVTEERMDVLHVLERAVLEKDGMRYVRVKQGDGMLAELPVRLGLRADGGRIEILEGVAAGAEVIVSVKAL